jgi:hypothetical protein
MTSRWNDDLILKDGKKEGRPSNNNAQKWLHYSFNIAASGNKTVYLDSSMQANSVWAFRFSLDRAKEYLHDSSLPDKHMGIESFGLCLYGQQVKALYIMIKYLFSYSFKI